MSKLVYVAGPYTHPDPIENTHEACRIADMLYEESGHFLVPIVPHTTMVWHMVVPHTDVNFWYDYDIEVMKRCDAVLRFPGKSSGADNEVNVALDHKLPVFFIPELLFAWARLQEERDALPG